MRTILITLLIVFSLHKAVAQDKETRYFNYTKIVNCEIKDDKAVNCKTENSAGKIIISEYEIYISHYNAYYRIISDYEKDVVEIYEVSDSFASQLIEYHANKNLLILYDANKEVYKYEYHLKPKS
jgi:hypothetical protein